MKRKLGLLSVALLIAAASLLSLVSCSKDGKETLLTDIYRESSSVKQFTGYREEMLLPEGWTVYTDGKAKGDSGYIEDIDVFVVQHTGGELSLMKCGGDSILIPVDQSIRSLKYAHGLIAAIRSDEIATVYSATTFKRLADIPLKSTPTSVNIDKVLKILDGSLVAVNSTYDAVNTSGYTSVYNVNAGGDPKKKLAAKVKNETANSLDGVDGFDGKYVTVTDRKTGGDEVNRIFRLPAGTLEGVKLNGTEDGCLTLKDNGESGYYCEVTYIGADRFLVHEDWVVNQDEDYTYYDGSEYVKADRGIFNGANGRLDTYSSEFIFLKTANSYYGADKCGVDAGSFLKDGYTYAAYGLSIDGNRIAYYDQFILDSNLNVVLSLSRNFGVHMEGDTENMEVGVYDLIMTVTDGMGYTPISPSIMRVYDPHRTVIFENREYDIKTAGYNDGMFIASIVKDGEELFGAFNVKGELVIPFEYDSIEPFRGAYTIATRRSREDDDHATSMTGKVAVIIGNNGSEVKTLSDGKKPLHDIATSGENALMYKTGCYMFKVKTGEIATFGLKTFDQNAGKSVIIPATLPKGSVLYSPSSAPEHVFVFEKLENTYRILRIV